MIRGPLLRSDESSVKERRTRIVMMVMIYYDQNLLRQHHN